MTPGVGELSTHAVSVLKLQYVVLSALLHFAVSINRGLPTGIARLLGTGSRKRWPCLFQPEVRGRRTLHHGVYTSGAAVEGNHPQRDLFKLPLILGHVYERVLRSLAGGGLETEIRRDRSELTRCHARSRRKTSNGIGKSRRAYRGRSMGLILDSRIPGTILRRVVTARRAGFLSLWTRMHPPSSGVSAARVRGNLIRVLLAARVSFVLWVSLSLHAGRCSDGHPRVVATSHARMRSKMRSICVSGRGGFSVPRHLC